MKRKLLICFAWFILAFTAGLDRTNGFPVIDWAVQFGAAGGDTGNSGILDRRGNAYITGHTEGGLAGPSQGQADTYVRKVNQDGSHAWTVQIGTPASFEQGTGLDISQDDNLYLSGIMGTTASAPRNAYIAKLSPNGDKLWERRLGGNGVANGLDVAVDHDNQAVYLAGFTQTPLVAPVGGQDGFLAKYDTSGNSLWIRQVTTTATDKLNTVDVDLTGNVVIGGSTEGTLSGINQGRDDLYIRKYSPEGDILWTYQAGSILDEAIGDIAIDTEGNIYGAGYKLVQTSDNPVRQSYDAFLIKLDAGGNLLWNHPMPSVGHEYGSGVAIGANGLIYMSGKTTGSSTSLGARSFFSMYAVFEPDGAMVELEQFGPQSDLRDVATNSAGHVLYVGTTFSSLFATHQGTVDAFLLRQTIVPEPRSFLMLAFVVPFVFLLRYEV